MNKGQQIGLGLNFLGLVLFVIWFIFRNRIPISLSITFAAFFLGLLLISIFLMIRSTRQGNKKES
jgi:hypothetical protein